MKQISFVVYLVLVVLAVAGCGKKSGLEGKVVDREGKPVANVKIIAEQVQSIKGYEQFETETDSDGTFRFKKLFPASEYVLSSSTEDWYTPKKSNVKSAPEGETIIMKTPVVVRQAIGNSFKSFQIK